MDKKILIVGHGHDTLSAALQIQMTKIGHEVEYIAPDEAKERGVTFKEAEPIEFKAPMPLEYVTPFEAPMSRRERRAKNRNKRKHFKP